MSNSLRPAWRAKGFSPPPQVKTERSNSTGSTGGGGTSTANKFAILDEDNEEEQILLAAAAVSSAVSSAAANSSSGTSNSRSEALRSASTSATTGARKGRSLAELARSSSIGEKPSSGHLQQPQPQQPSPPSVAAAAAAPSSKPSIRFTRERLLSLRPPPLPQVPESLQAALEGTGAAPIILSDSPQDPVCWDAWDPDEIWDKQPHRRSIGGGTIEGAVTGPPKRSSATISTAASAMNAVSSSAPARSRSDSMGRWQRGVALPPKTSTGGSRENEDNNLWDDTGNAANDFSAFGAMPEDEEFDFEKMAEATKKLDEEIHGRSRSDTESSSLDPAASSPTNNVFHTTRVDASRPLAQAATMIRSGSGDDVNVFEDFDEPTPGEDNNTEKQESLPIRSATEDPSASSRLMAMIGVKREQVLLVSDDEEIIPTAAPPPEPEPEVVPIQDTNVPPSSAATTTSAWGPLSSEPLGSNALAGILLNPWGDGSLIPSAPEPALDLQAQIRAAELEQQRKAAEMRRQQEAQQRLQQEQQRQREQQHQQQSQGVQSQVELVLMERITAILENSWGRADLPSILAALHAEDTRVIPLLNNVDALRALIIRNSRRVAIRQDPTLRAEMATLLMTNIQWQQHQQQEEAFQRQQRQLEAQRLQQQQQQQQLASQAVIPDAPWYYSDPQKNIQGPFRGEEMRQWLEAGYFKGDLPISQNPTGPFRLLSHVFSDTALAFVTVDNNVAQEATAAAARAQAEELARRAAAERAQAEAEEQARLRRQAEEREWQRSRELEEAKHRAEEERRLQAEAEATEAAATAKVANANGEVNESSTQLKMMLGLGAASATQPVVAESKQITDSPKEKRATKKNGPKSNKISPEPAESVASKPAAVPAPAPAAWGGAAVSQPKKKSMSEIQKEEAQKAAVAAMNRQTVRSSSGGWANVAAARGGSSAWAGGTTKQQPAAEVLSANPRGQPRTLSMQPNSASAANAQTAAHMQQAQRSKSLTCSGGIDPADAFGAKMSPALEKWCKDQMNKLNGTDDLTLVAFCTTLNDPDEIRQYLTAYLGSTPQVNNFATEFINRKGLGKEKQEEAWESTVSGKKGRKKKTGTR